MGSAAGKQLALGRYPEQRVRRVGQGLPDQNPGRPRQGYPGNAVDPADEPAMKAWFSIGIELFLDAIQKALAKPAVFPYLFIPAPKWWNW